MDSERERNVKNLFHICDLEKWENQEVVIYSNGKRLEVEGGIVRT